MCRTPRGPTPTGSRSRSAALVDVSHEVLDLDRTELGHDVTYIETDVLDWLPTSQFDCWHDRAFFHFLVNPEDQARYVATATAAVSPGGALVMGVFAEDGPTSCSGLPATGHRTDQLAALFAGPFELERAEREEHRTPQGVVQPISWVVLRRSTA